MVRICHLEKFAFLGLIIIYLSVDKINVKVPEQNKLTLIGFHKPNKQNVYEINLFKKFNFSQSQNNCWHTDWCQEWNIKTA